MTAEEILDLLPKHFNGEQSTNNGRYQDLKNIASSAEVQVGEGILWKSKLEHNYQNQTVR